MSLLDRSHCEPFHITHRFSGVRQAPKRKIASPRCDRRRLERGSSFSRGNVTGYLIASNLHEPYLLYLHQDYRFADIACRLSGMGPASARAAWCVRLLR